MRSVEARPNYYIGRHTFDDATASKALNNVVNDQRSEQRKQKRLERVRKNTARKDAEEHNFVNLDPSRQRQIELEGTVHSFAMQLRAGSISRRVFEDLTKPYRMELRRLAKL